jgi:hypothetical protein
VAPVIVAAMSAAFVAEPLHGLWAAGHVIIKIVIFRWPYTRATGRLAGLTQTWDNVRRSARAL